MKTSSYSRMRLILAGSAAFLLAAATNLRAGSSAEAREAEKMDALAKTQGSAVVVDNLSSRFATFAGSQANATALITGLHDGTAVNLTATANGQTTVTTFTPPTGKLGYGEVFLSLALAQEQLTKLGIAQPTAAQIEAALDGGSVTTGSGTTAKTTQLNGVLALRSEGKGWGQIAQSMGVKLGPVISDLRSADQHLNGQLPSSAHVAMPDRPENAAAAAASARPEIPNRPELPGHH